MRALELPYKYNTVTLYSVELIFWFNYFVMKPYVPEKWQIQKHHERLVKIMFR